MSRLAIVFASMSFLACSARSVPTTQPALTIGAAMPCKPISNELHVIASAQTARGCYVTDDGVRYFVATIDDHRIAYISTTDPQFVTPEGIRSGDSLALILAKGGSPVLGEVGWAFYSELPSGWCAVFPGIPDHGVTQPPSQEAAWFFVRK